MKFSNATLQQAGTQLIMPILLYILVYFLSPYLPHLKINIAEPYSVDKYLFGINSLTINEWWQLHRSLPFDAITSISYISFFFVFLFAAVYFYLFLHDKSKPFTLGWSLFWIGILYLITSHLYPVAPPWYVTQNGLSDAFIQLHAHANASGCDNFDAWTGYSLCAKYVGSGPYPFGAMFSMHVGIPWLLVCYAFKYQRLKTACILFYLLEVFATLYLNQHYVIDLLVGTMVTLMVVIVVDKYYVWKTSGTGFTFTRNNIPDKINKGTTIKPAAWF